MRKISILLISLFLTGCTFFFPQQKQAILQDQQSYCLAFEEFQESHRIEALQQLQIDFPDSVWAARAETIILYVQELDQRKAQNKKLRATEKQLATELELLKESNKKLVNKVELLKKLYQESTQTIEQLKSSLIQSENHPK